MIKWKHHKGYVCKNLVPQFMDILYMKEWFENEDEELYVSPIGFCKFYGMYLDFITHEDVWETQIAIWD